MSIKHRADGRDLIVDHQWDICTYEFEKNGLSYRRAYARNAWKLDQTASHLSIAYTDEVLNMVYFSMEKTVEYYYGDR